MVFVSGRSGDTILLGVGSCLMFFIGGSTKLLNIVVWPVFKVGLYRIDLSLDLSL